MVYQHKGLFTSVWQVFKVMSFTVIFSYMHKLYFKHIHLLPPPLLSFLFPNNSFLGMCAHMCECMCA